jgi:hypothetical protein
MVFPMHGSCLDSSIFSKYTDAVMKNEFAYSGIVLGQKVPVVTRSSNTFCHSQSVNVNLNSFKVNLVGNSINAKPMKNQYL